MPDGSIVLMGGYEAGSGYVNDTWRSMDNGATWTQMTATAGWSARGYHTSAAMPDGSIVLMGGYDGIKKNDTWRSTDNGATWTQLPNAGWSARSTHSSVAMPDGSIVLMGGAQQGGSFLTNNETWRFDPTGSSVKNPSHTYTAPGTYQVALQARDASGYSSTWKSGYIWVDIAPPGWKFRADAHNTGVYDDGGITPTNNVRWSYNAPWIPTGGAVGSSPAIANGVVYIGSEDYNVTAINATTGAKIWNFTTGGTVWSNPAVANGVVYVGSNEPNVYAINASTGAKIWNFMTGDGVSSGPAVANGVVYVGSEDKNVYAINASTGAKIWNFTTSSYVISSPAVANGVVYIGGGDYNVYAINANTGAKIWNFTTGGRVLSSPAVANGVVYVGSNDQNVYAINANTGAKIWNFTTGGRVVSSPAVANGVVYVGSEDYNVTAINASTGAKIWNFTTGGEVGRSSPAVANGVVYVGSRDYNVYAINASTGAKIWNFTTGGYVDSSPAVANGTVYFGSHDGNVYALGGTSGIPRVADFDYDASHGLTVQFNDTSTGGPESWSWDFGDGNSSTEQNPENIYPASGDYQVNLTAGYSGGYSAFATKQVTVAVITLDEARFIAPTPAHPIEEAIHFTRNPVAANTVVKLPGGQASFNIPGIDGYLAATYPKGMNGDGPTNYTFMYKDPNTGTKTVDYLGEKNSLPTNIILEGESPLSEINSVNSVSPNPGGGLGTLNLVGACSAGDCNNNYALLIDGGKNATMNHIRYWNDISFMYQTLTVTYGYPKNHIIVLMSDGPSNAADRHNATTAANVSLTDSSPLDLDTDNNAETIGAATKANVISNLTTSYTALTSADSLFIFTTGHGGQDAIAPGTNNSILYLWNEEYINDTEFVGNLPTQPGNITMVMEQCYSGGFVDNFTTQYTGTQKRIIATAANGSEPSYGNGFSNVWTRGVAMITDGRTPAKEADVSPYGNNNGKIAMSEVFAFANGTDPYASHSLANHEHPQYSTKNLADTGATKYLVSGACTPPNTIKVSAPNTPETWHIGSKRNITWTPAGNVSQHNVKIELYNGVTRTQSLINASTPASTGLFTWTIPNSAGTSYKVNITDIESGATAKDMSDTDFVIKTGNVLGSLNVSSQSAATGAAIYLDGLLQTGKTTTAAGTLLSSIAPGSHTVTVTLTNFLDQSKGIVLPSGTTRFGVPFVLEPVSGNSVDDTGTMVITSTISEAEVWIDGSYKGNTPFMEEVVPGTDWTKYPKKYPVQLRRFGYKPSVLQDVEVGRGWTVNADIPLTPEDWLYTIGDFSSPIDMPPVVNSVKAGQAIPTKWHLSDVNGGDVFDPASFVNLRSYPVSCTEFIGSPEDAINESAAGGSDLQYKGNGNWQFNWKTPKSYNQNGGCRNMYVEFYKGQRSPEAKFKFK
jgi:outer membrane protein assembly factor BamB